ncbi:MAG: 50S ribosomal protein L18 [Candidatus Omnitrophica bacterium]|nr:50S ribosomal protein L18 [Candidatus Omnitrophota bacterium]
MGLKGIALRRKRIRRKIIGTKDRPRLCVHRSINHICAQLIDDIESKTLFSMSTNSKEIKDKTKSFGNVKAASLLGEAFASGALKKGFSAVVFDRSGYQYHGRVKALADSCRKKGLKF